MSRWTKYATTDMDEAVAFFRASFVDLTLRRPTDTSQAVDLSTATAELAPESTLTRIHYSQRTDLALEPARAVIIDFVIGGRVALTDQGRRHAVTRGDALLLPPDRPASVEFDGLDVLILQLPRDLIDDVAEAGTGINPADLRFDCARPITSATNQHWQHALTYVQRAVLDDPATATNPLILEQAQRLLATIVLTGWANTSQNARPARRPHVPPAVVRRAMDYIEQNAGRPLRITEIAQAAGISPRALQQAFRRHNGTTPTAYARRVRLEHAHHDLKAADPHTGDTVAAIAIRWGFVNTSRFSTDYHARYGRPPSQTLRS